MNRRTVLAGVGTVGLASLAGCLGATGLDEYAASPARIESGVLAETGYARAVVDEIVTEESIDYLVFDEEVVVRNYLTEYEKSVDMGPFGTRRTAGFLLLTSPQIRVLDREFNPVAEMGADELVDLLADSYDGIGDVSYDDTDTTTVLGQETARSTYDAVSEFGDFDLDVTLQVTEPVETEEDFLATIAIHPEQSPQEADNVTTLVDAVADGSDESVE